ncbi:fiber [Bearded dragon adenovirus 1]|uniref:Fiber n=1 Tax=Bearded dragon adenovirus 1 TaxID=2729647 RepID=A0A6M4MIZ8_9ADEN|nr:fiber [Bearded dragon adenovirus 1]QJR83104.1 fiber [Bearded dragon adenovirus 1]
MKRARSPSPDPVYPFDGGTPVPLPPFLLPGRGLETDGLALSVKVQNPLNLNTGGVGLKYGSGLSLNEEGELVGNSTGSISVSPPLKKTGDELSLSVGDGLTVAEETLSVNPAAPLSIDATTKQLQLNTGRGVGVYNGKIELKTRSPVGLDDQDYIFLDTDTPFNVRAGKLVLDVEPPLAVDDRGALTVGTTDGVGIVDGKLSLKANFPLESDGQGSIQLKTGGGLRVDPTTGLKVAVKSPLSVDAAENIELNVGGGLSTDGGALSLKVAVPLSVDSTDQTVSLAIGDGLQITDGKLATAAAGTIDVVDPLQNTPSGVGLKYDSVEFKLDANGALASTLVCDEPLVGPTFTNHIGLKYGQGLRVGDASQGQYLEVWLGESLFFGAGQGTSYPVECEFYGLGQDAVYFYFSFKKNKVRQTLTETSYMYTLRMAERNIVNSFANMLPLSIPAGPFRDILNEIMPNGDSMSYVAAQTTGTMRMSGNILQIYTDKNMSTAKTFGPLYACKSTETTGGS